MSAESQDSPERVDPVRPPPLPANVETPPAPPTNWKKIFWIVALSLLAALGIMVVIGALLFGGCMWLVKQTGH